MNKGHMMYAMRTAIILLLVSICTSLRSPRPRILVFSKTAGFHHKSIVEGNEAIIGLGKTHGFGVDTTTDAKLFTKKNLQQYQAVVFLNTTGNVLDEVQQTAFEDYIHGGGGFVGVHAASDTEYDWPWYGRLVGAYFKSHPAPQEATLDVVDGEHASTRHLPAKWMRMDEWYNFKWVSDSIHVLIKIDESSYTGNRMGTDHPMCWYHNFEGGRAFYTELGHTAESYTTDSLYRLHLLGGIKYAMSKK